MKFNIITLLTFSLLSIFVYGFKLPNPSPAVLIVNHLNYLRYDYLSNPHHLNLRPTNSYPFYESVHLNRHLNRTEQFNLYSINRTNNHLGNLINLNNLDDQLNGRLDQELTYELNDRLNNQLNAQLNLNEELNLPNQQINELENDLNNQPTDQEPHFNEDQLNENTFNELIPNDLNNNDLNNQNNNLILTNSTRDQQRLIELNLLQQTEPSLSLILDSDSSFLNNIQVNCLF